MIARLVVQALVWAIGAALGIYVLATHPKATADEALTVAAIIGASLFAVATAMEVWREFRESRRPRDPARRGRP